MKRLRRNQGHTVVATLSTQLAMRPAVVDTDQRS